MLEAVNCECVYTCIWFCARLERVRRRQTDGLAEAYQLICPDQHSSHLYLPVQLAAIHTHNSFLWIRCPKPLPVFNYLTASCISTFPVPPLHNGHHHPQFSVSVRNTLLVQTSVLTCMSSTTQPIEEINMCLLSLIANHLFECKHKRAPPDGRLQELICYRPFQMTSSSHQLQHLTPRPRC